ncbi:MAG: hypothetical protein IJC64_04570, partial [Clostridia bacterium]|nr:hypothetical protein [Clostridia bacterium]
TEPATTETTEPATTETTEPATTETTEPEETQPKPEETEPKPEETQPKPDEPVVPEEPKIPDDPDEETENENPVSNITQRQPCHPNHAIDDLYHWSPECDGVCDDPECTKCSTGGTHHKAKNAGAKSEHVLYCEVEDQGDVILYTYFCRDCKYEINSMEVPTDLTMYFSPDDLMNCTQHLATMPEFVRISPADGVMSTEFKSESGMATTINIFQDDGNSVSTGKYLIMKIKLNTGRTSFKLEVASMEAYRRKSGVASATAVATIGGVTPGWSTVIVDLSKIVMGDKGYLPDSNGEYCLNTVKVTLDGVSAVAKNDTVEIAYVGFCETLAEARAFAADEHVRYVYSDVSATPFPDIIDGTPCRHNYSPAGEGSSKHYSDPCDVCKDKGGLLDHKYTYTDTLDENGMCLGYKFECVCGMGQEVEFDLPEGSILNYVSAPGKVINNWETRPVTMTEDGVIFTRVYSNNDHGSVVFRGCIDTGFNNRGVGYAISDVEPLVGGSGRYAVLKFRLGGDSINYLQLGAYNGSDELVNKQSKNAGFIYEKIQSRRSTKDMTDEWQVVVIDIAAAYDSKLYPAQDATLEAASFGLKLWGAGIGEDDYVDIAFFAVASDWGAVETILTNEGLAEVTYASKWMYTDSKHDVTRTFDGKCASASDHLAGVRDVNKVFPDAYNADLCYTCRRETYCTNELCDSFVSEGTDNVQVGHDIVISEKENTRTYLGGENDSVCYTYGATYDCVNCTRAPEDGTENGAHLLDRPVLVEYADGGYRLASECTDEVCTHAKYLKYVCANRENHTSYSCSNEYYAPICPEGVNYYSAPGQIVNLWATSDNESKGGSAGEYATSETYRDRKEPLGNIIHDENGTYIKVGVYHSASVYLANDTTEYTDHAEFGSATDLLTPGNGGIGQYVVIKLRTYNLNEGVKLGIVANSGENGAIKEVKTYNVRPASLMNQGEFITYVIQLDSTVLSAEATKVCVKLGTDQSANAGAGFDFGYFAICDSWTEVDRVIGNDDVKYITNWTTDAGVDYTADQVDQKVAQEASAQ